MVIGRALIAATVVVACVAASLGAKAEDPAAAYPAKPVRIIIGPTANFTDIVTRQLAQRLHEVWQQPVVVENRASGMMGAAAVAVDWYSARWLPGDALVLQLVRLAAAIGIAVAVLAAAAHFLHIDEFRRGVALVTSRFRRRRP